MKLFRGSPRYLELAGNIAPIQPLYLMLNLATRCCYGCLKCALPGTGSAMCEPLPEAERERIIGIAAQAGVKALVIVGAGEPTDKQSFSLVKSVIEQAHAVGMLTILFTTLYGLTEDQAQFFYDHGASLYISLDSLDPSTYAWLTGGGKLHKVIQNISRLRRLFRVDVMGENTVVRLGINTTVVRQNVFELEGLREFAGPDIHYVANPPIYAGKFTLGNTWEELVGGDYDFLLARAQEVSSTGGHSSVNEGVCSYFFRGVSVDTDGKLLTCGYAGETGQHLAHVTDIRSVGDFLRHYVQIALIYWKFGGVFDHLPSCPLRDSRYPEFVNLCNPMPFSK